MEIREMLTDDLDFALSLTEAEGWSSIRRDFEELLLFDPHGCFVGEEDGISIGMVCALSYGPFASIGNLIVVNDFQGQGKGAELMEHAMDYVKNKGTDVMMLDSVPDAVPLYERLGFKKVCRSLRLAGYVEPRLSQRVRPMEGKDLMHILSVDRKYFGASRFLFISSGLAACPEFSIVVEVDGEIAGYVMGSERHGHVRLAPWIMSDHPEMAEDVLRDFAVQAGGLEIRAGVLETSRRAIGVYKACGLIEKGHSWRMVRGTEEKIEFSDEIYAIGSPMRG
ncbi:MAG: GNAT family N-acetyltransferase [Candidatus Thorarchaeota archaeon]